MSSKNMEPLTGDVKYRIEGLIKVKYKENIKFNVCKVTYESYEGDNYQYVFEPYYDVIDGLPSNVFQGIPGLNLDKRKERYYRINIVPVFISERSVNKNRNNLHEELNSVGLDCYNQLEWLIRTNTEYSGDNLIVERYNKFAEYKEFNCDNLAYGDTLNDLEQLSADYYKNLKQTLKIVGSGANIESKEIKVDKNNRGDILKLLIYQYEIVLKSRWEKQKAGIEKAKKKNVYKGRKKIKLDDVILEDITRKLLLKIISVEEALKLTKLKSKSTLYRRIKEYKEKHINKM